MKERQRKSFIVGIFVLIGIFLFIFTIYLIGTKEYVFNNPKRVYAIFTDVKGLQEGDKVRMSGIDVGTVSSMTILANSNVYVEMHIEREQFARIHEGYNVLIGSQGLMGAKVLKIEVGEIPGDFISENDTLITIEKGELDDIVQQLSGATGNIIIITEELVGITQKINRGEGIFGKLMSDASMSASLDETLLNLEKISKNFKSVSDEIHKGSVIENINKTASNLKEITETINSGEGTIGQLLTDTSLISSFYLSSKNLQATTENLMVMTAALNNDSSALNLLIDDPSFADSLEVMIENLNIGIIEATEAAEAVQKSGLIRLGSKKKKKEAK